MTSEKIFADKYCKYNSLPPLCPHDFCGVSTVNNDVTSVTAAKQNNSSLLLPPLPVSAFMSLTSVFLLQVHQQQGQIPVVGRQQSFDPTLLTRLVVSGKLVRTQAWLAPHQRESKLLLRLTQLDRAALQNNDSCQVSVWCTFLVEQEVTLQDTPALLIGRLNLTLQESVCFKLIYKSSFVIWPEVSYQMFLFFKITVNTIKKKTSLKRVYARKECSVKQHLLWQHSVFLVRNKVRNLVKRGRTNIFFFFFGGNNVVFCYEEHVCVFVFLLFGLKLVNK